MNKPHNNYKQKWVPNQGHNRDQTSRPKLFDDKTLESIINYIYDSAEYHKYKFKMLEYESQLEDLKTNKYYISGDYSGIPNILIFTRVNGRNTAFMIDKRGLPNNRQQVSIPDLTLNPVHSHSLAIDNSIYNGTIMDGIFILNKRANTKSFIINDIYIFRGDKLNLDTIAIKLFKLNSYLEQNHYNKNSNLNLIVNQLYELDKITVLREEMEKNKIYVSRGISFYPEYSGTKLVYLFSNEPAQPQILASQLEEKDKDIIVTDIKKKLYYKFETDKENVTKCLEVRITDKPDVYQILCLDKVNLTTFKTVNLGIALIPTIECSTMCNNLFKTKKHGKALFYCKLVKEKNRWVPLKEATDKKRPDFVSELKEDVELLEVSEEIL